jgi:hypothetical protein
MSSLSHSHTPFSELPTESRALFFIFALAATARFSVHPPTPAELAPQLETVWSGHKLRDEDLADPYRMTALLEETLTPVTAADI